MNTVREVCPRCSNRGRKVKRVTLERLLRPERRAEITAERYYVCTTPACDTVYFSPEVSQVFAKSDLIVRFGLKEKDSPRPVCYCFDHTTEEIEEEIRRTGQSTAVERIRDSIGREGCHCETTNPLGVCCLRSVEAVVAEAFQTLGIEQEAVGIAEVVETDCCEPTNDPSPSIGRGDRVGVLAAGGSVVAAILSSACCWLPLLLIGFGVTAGGVAGFFEAYRLYFVLGAVGMLGVGFYMVTFRQEKCEPGSACATSSRRIRIFRRGMLWTSSVLVTGFVFFPNYVGYVLGSPGSTIVANADHLASAEYRIEGMTCQGCADRLRSKLARVPGVADVSVDYASKTAIVRYVPEKPVSSEQVIEAVTAAGYKAIISGNAPGHTERTAEK